MSNNQQSTADKCEALFAFAAKDQDPVRTREGERESEGGYVNAWSDATEAWNLKHGDYIIRATHVRWQTLNLSADADGTRRILEILEGDKVIFRARQEGASTTKKFSGPDERYVGTENKPAGTWEVKEGEVPSALNIV
jgi:hypothetical protein